MFICLPLSQHEAVHNLVTLHIYPEQALRIGQSDRSVFRNAEIAWERTGNLYSSGPDAVTYRYCIDAPGFNACLLAVWPDQDHATADVHVVAITPNGEDAHEAFAQWLMSVVDAKMPPRDLFRGLELQ